MRTLKRQWNVGFAGAALIVAMTAFPSLAEACHGHMMHGHMQEGHGQGEKEEHGGHYLKHLLKHAKEIGLTPEQIGKLKAMELDFKRADVRLEADIKVAQLELHALMEDEQADLPAIHAKVEQLKKAEGARLIAAIKSKRNAMAILTSDQKEKDRAHREHMQHEGQGQHGGGMMGGMGGMGGGGTMGGGGHGGQGGSGASGGQQHQH